MFKFVQKIDALWCGDTQLPASFVNLLETDVDSGSKLAWLRIATALTLFIDLLGIFFITLGFSWKPSLFFIGIVLKVGGGLFSSVYQNKAGNFLGILLTKWVEKIQFCREGISTILSNRGSSEEEIRSLLSLPNQIYQTELIGYQRTKIYHILSPISCGFALLLIGELTSAGIIVLLGLISVPLSEFFFKKYSSRIDARIRFGRAANFTQFLKRAYEAHLRQVFCVNVLSQLPLILFAARLLVNGEMFTLSLFYAYTQGLIGLTGMFTFQKNRISSVTTTTIVKNLIHALTCEDFLLSPYQRKRHCSQTSGIKVATLRKADFEGVAIVDFQAIDFSAKNASDSPLVLTSYIPKGGLCVLQAPSGYGKTTFLLALQHILNHTGDIYFVENKVWKNIHEFSEKAIEDFVFFTQESNIHHSYRIVDLFQKVFVGTCAKEFAAIQSQWGDDFSTLLWKTPDNLLEAEQALIEAGQTSIFPKDMLSTIKHFRYERYEFVRRCLSKSNGNLANDKVHPNRIFISLSSGEKKRLITLLAKEHAKAFSSVRLIIFDEPLANLDECNISAQLDEIREIQHLPHHPSILVISHLYISQLLDNTENATLSQVGFEQGRVLLNH